MPIGAKATPGFVGGIIDTTTPVKQAFRAATTEALPASTYTNGPADDGVGAKLIGDVNGALPSIDGVALVVDDRLVVQDQVAQLENGFYKVDVVGTGATKFELSRVQDADEDAEILARTHADIEEGDVHKGVTLAYNGSAVPDIGVDAITFEQVTIDRTKVWVNNTNYDSIKDAFAAAVNGDTVMVPGRVAPYTETDLLGDMTALNNKVNFHFMEGVSLAPVASAKALFETDPADAFGYLGRISGHAEILMSDDASYHGAFYMGNALDDFIAEFRSIDAATAATKAVAIWGSLGNAIFRVEKNISTGLTAGSGAIYFDGAATAVIQADSINEGAFNAISAVSAGAVLDIHVREATITGSASVVNANSTGVVNIYFDKLSSTAGKVLDCAGGVLNAIGRRIDGDIANVLVSNSGANSEMLLRGITAVNANANGRALATATSTSKTVIESCVFEATYIGSIVSLSDGDITIKESLLENKSPNVAADGINIESASLKLIGSEIKLDQTAVGLGAESIASTVAPSSVVSRNSMYNSPIASDITILEAVRNGDQRYNTVTDAIDNARDGDTIIIEAPYIGAEENVLENAPDNLVLDFQPGSGLENASLPKPALAVNQVAIFTDSTRAVGWTKIMIKGDGDFHVRENDLSYEGLIHMTQGGSKLDFECNSITADGTQCTIWNPATTALNIRVKDRFTADSTVNTTVIPANQYICPFAPSGAGEFYVSVGGRMEMIGKGSVLEATGGAQVYAKFQDVTSAYYDAFVTFGGGATNIYVEFATLNITGPVDGGPIAFKHVSATAGTKFRAKGDEVTVNGNASASAIAFSSKEMDLKLGKVIHTGTLGSRSFQASSTAGKITLQCGDIDSIAVFSVFDCAAGNIIASCNDISLSSAAGHIIRSSSASNGSMTLNARDLTSTASSEDMIESLTNNGDITLRARDLENQGTGGLFHLSTATTVYGEIRNGTIDSSLSPLVDMEDGATLNLVFEILKNINATGKDIIFANGDSNGNIKGKLIDNTAGVERAVNLTGANAHVWIFDVDRICNDSGGKETVEVLGSGAVIFRDCLIENESATLTTGGGAIKVLSSTTNIRAISSRFRSNAAGPVCRMESTSAGEFHLVSTRVENPIANAAATGIAQVAACLTKIFLEAGCVIALSGTATNSMTSAGATSNVYAYLCHANKADDANTSFQAGTSLTVDAGVL